MSNDSKAIKFYNVIAALIFLVGVGTFSYMGVINWLPPLCIIVGISLAVRQMLMGLHFDAFVAVIIFGACFFSSFLTLFSRIFLPTFLIIGAVYFIGRQFFRVKEKIVVKATDISIEKEPEETGNLPSKKDS
jgi:hypothetical protein